MILVLLATLAAALSFAKFDHCRNTNWKSPDSYVHACYSDIPLLLANRGLMTHQWSYSGGENSVEYPVITGAVMWATSWITDLKSNPLVHYFDVNAIFISLLFVGCVLMLRRMRPNFAYLLAISPAVIASIFINWDLWGISTMLLAIIFFDEKRFNLSALALGISIATKFFPVLLLLPIAVIFWRSALLKRFVIYAVQTFAVWVFVNLPVALTTPTGWWRFYDLNLKRSADWGSLWHALSVLGINIDHVNFLSLIALIAVVSALALFILGMAYTPTLAEISFIALALTLCVGKVYSPQYVLWLAPLGIIAMRGRHQIGGFWVWQAGEAIYHLAIWQHLAAVQGATFGLPETGYALATLIRIGTTAYFVGIIAIDLRRKSALSGVDRATSPGGLSEFLFGTASSYP